MTSDTSPRAWLDHNHVPCFRADVTLEEACELQDMLSSAFNAGVLSGYEQATGAAIKRVHVKRPRVSWVYYREGAQRGPLVYFKRPGILRVQGRRRRRRGIIVYWLGWL